MSTQHSSQKPQQFTRKKIQQFSYGLNDIIGKGYSSQVYKGRHDNSQQPVAVKVIDMKMLKNEINRTLLESEIQILKELKDVPNVLKFHEVYTTKNNTYIVTQLCSSDLTKKIKQKLTQPQAFHYMDQVIQGYLQVHQKQIVHRDLKPPNILLTQHDQCKIADFGFAIKNEQLSKPSKYNVGSPLYMAPQSLKKNEYSYKTDVWSVGVIFFQLLTGDTPWKAKTEKELLKKIETERIQSIIEKRRLKFTGKTMEFLSKCLCIDKQKRMDPQQLRRYNFSSSKQVNNVLMETKLNTINQHLSSNKKLNTTLTSPKNHEATKFNFTNTSANFKSIKGENTTSMSFNRTMKLYNLNNTNNNTIPKDQNGHMKAQLKRQDIKMISKQLISEIHFCRYLFKLLTRIKESSLNGMLVKFQRECQLVEKIYTMFIRHKIERLISFGNQNFLHLQPLTYQQYKQCPDYKKILKISKQYNQRYKSELTSQNWNHYFDKRFTTFQTLELIQKMCNAFVKDNEEIQKNIQKYQQDVVILDYLITAKQLLEILNQGENYQKFSRKSKIQEIVEGTTATITIELYRKIVERAKEIICLH